MKTRRRQARILYLVWSKLNFTNTGKFTLAILYDPNEPIVGSFPLKTCHFNNTNKIKIKINTKKIYSKFESDMLPLLSV